jgi:cold shock CspA family protein
MKGTIALIKKGLGKIILDNKETPVLSLPDSFEEGDIVEVDFENNNLEKPIKLIAYSKDKYYGNVIGDFKGGGIILVTYPKLIGTIVFKGNFKKQDKVEFRLKKTKEIEAIDVKLTKELYKCFLPSFGSLEKRVIFPKNGVVEEVRIEEENVIEGEIKSVGNRGYGFIRSEIGDVFFFISNFERVYGKIPYRGDRVIFKYSRNNRGYIVQRFYTSKPKLPENRRYLVIDNKKIPLFVYQRFYKKLPEIGDVVNYIEENNQIKFLNSDEPIEKIIFIKKEKEPFYKGVISFIKDNYGFINSNIGKVFFSISNFERFYKRKPKKNETIYFRYIENEKGLSVRQFVTVKFEVNKKAFKNFATINETHTYYAYVNKTKVEEVFRYDPNELSISISCFKNSVDNRARLDAINCLIENEYESKKITKEVLLEEKLELLEKLIKRAKNVYEKLELEAEYQKIRFSPQRLKTYQLNGINFIKIGIIKDIKFNEDSFEFLLPNKYIDLPIKEQKIDFIENQELKELSLEENQWKIIFI